MSPPFGPDLGGASGVSSVTAGTGISIGGTPQNPTINNTGVLSVAQADASFGVVGGSAANPTVGTRAGAPGRDGAAFANQTNSSQIGPSASAQFVGTNYTSTKTGLFHVIGILAANASGVSTQTITLRMDQAGNDVVLDTIIAGTGGAGPFSGTMGSIVQLVAGETHNFAVRAVASAGTNTIPTNNARILILEL